MFGHTIFYYGSKHQRWQNKPKLNILWIFLPKTSGTESLFQLQDTSCSCCLCSIVSAILYTIIYTIVTWRNCPNLSTLHHYFRLQRVLLLSIYSYIFHLLYNDGQNEPRWCVSHLHWPVVKHSVVSCWKTGSVFFFPSINTLEEELALFKRLLVKSLKCRTITYTRCDPTVSRLFRCRLPKFDTVWRMLSAQVWGM